MQLSSSLSLSDFFSYKLSISIGSQKALEEIRKSRADEEVVWSRAVSPGSLPETLHERGAIWFFGQCLARLDHQAKLFFPNVLSTMIQILNFYYCFN